jgi:hypothetical protein
MKGKFSLQNILSTNHGTETSSSSRRSTHSGDPVDMGLVDYSTAFSLYSEYVSSSCYPVHLLRRRIAL